MSLTLICYVIAKVKGSDKLDVTNGTEEMLQKLYGVDGGSLRSYLREICYTGKSVKRRTGRGETEVCNHF